MEQHRAPYLEALTEWAGQGNRSFHMPGHGQGRAAPRPLKSLFGSTVFACDTTQVLGLDDFHHPRQACLEAQRLAAQAYGVEQTCFMVNGSSGGNHLMALTALRAGDAVLVPRNAHRSVLGALMLSGAEPVVYSCPYDQAMEAFHPPRIADLEEVYQSGHKALWLSTPTYFGAAADVDGLIDWAHQRDLVVLTDEAWGAHLAFHPELPRSAVAAGSDLVVQSPHKTASGLSQAAWLHRQGNRVDPARLEFWLRTLMSTSPSTLVLASLDAARRQLVEEGEALWGDCLALARQARERLQQIPGVTCFGRPPAAHWDETRLIIRVQGWSGHRLEEHLRRQEAIQVEMSDCSQVVLMMLPGHEQQDVDALVQAFRRIEIGQERDTGCRSLPPTMAFVMSLRQAVLADWEMVPAEEAVGRVCAEMLTPYPPGIPALCPGQLVSSEWVVYLRKEIDLGRLVEGAHDPSLATLRVVK